MSKIQVQILLHGWNIFRLKIKKKKQFLFTSQENKTFCDYTLLLRRHISIYQNTIKLSFVLLFVIFSQYVGHYWHDGNITYKDITFYQTLGARIYLGLSAFFLIVITTLKSFYSCVILNYIIFCLYTNKIFYWYVNCTLILFE